MSIQGLFQHLANGISLGSLYALIAIGYTMVYGILRLVNFAHGDIFMLGAYLTFYGMTYLPLPWWLIFILASVTTGFLGFVLEKLAYKPLRGQPRITILISAIGASFLIENVAILVFGGRPKAFPVPDVFKGVLVIGGVSISTVTFVIPVVTLVLLFALTWWINKTKTGMAMRALSKEYEAASLMGIDINSIISVTFFVGSFLGAVGGIMWGIKYPQLVPLMGIIPGIKCFIAAVIGGIGNIKGAVVGGFILGLGEILIVAFLPALTGYRDAFAFILLILILLVKPTGLMGEKMAEKV
ncbi:branched-chain amino acid ABC transporter permease [Youngiibacter fragilis]|uniref:Branched-chain amino acid ABC transporter permease n=1 Tax=Youngiibacter fragilis 232.1 TaxID=994573 RepID=V7I0L6_9CLOT|nr:branched-chain amino acid ABC transporter permease [Youngiibacter fragilis]ETA79423.1 branched-chain amino acid ABC transporter permease [Youngiibacter fragilis 232.1]